MAKSLTLRSSLRIAGEFVNGLDLGEAKYPIQFAIDHALANGTGNNQANAAFTDARSIAASSSEELDLAGVLAEAFGATLNFTKVKLLAIVADDGNTNDVIVGGAAANAFAAPFGDATDAVKVGPGGTLVLVSPKGGYTVTGGTADKLKIANSGSGTAVGYKILIVGVA